VPVPVPDEGGDDLVALRAGDPVPETWTRAAQELSPDDLPSYGRPMHEEAQAWMLDLLASEIEPRTHPARPAYFATNESWTTRARGAGSGRSDYPACSEPADHGRRPRGCQAPASRRHHRT